MKKETAIFGFIAVAAAAFLIGRATIGGGDDKGADDKKGVEAVKAVAKGDSDIIPVGTSYTKGPATAPITIVEFSEFQCPFCSRVNPTIKQIQDTYKDKVRIVFKHNPLPFHKDAPLAAEAALAAGAQGKFWEMHDKLFQDTKALQRESIEKYATEIGLDMAKFKADLDGGKFKKDVEADMALAAKVGARGTPNFFINGVQVTGARPFDSFKEVIDAQLAAAEQAQKDGTKADELYAAMVKKNFKEPAKAEPAAQGDTSKDVYKVPVGQSYTKGAQDALVTIVEFSEFQCPFCSRVNPTIKQILDTYPGKVKVVFKHNPLAFHQDAPLAAKASLAAGKQGKFWEMHDKLFENQKALKRENLEQYAQGLGLDMGKFKADLDGTELDALWKADQELANRLGAQGTPNFFVNGRNLVGAQPFDAFKKLIDEEITKAEALVKAGTPLAQVYDKLTEKGLTKAAAAAPQRKPAADDTTVYKVPVESADAVKGPNDALVTIVEFSEFQCPFCKRVGPTLKQVTDKYGKDVRIVFKHNPLPFHKDAPSASKAALAAGAQGKFWEMHDKLFENQQALDDATIEKHAQELGLNIAKFKADWKSDKFQAQIDADQKLAQQIGAGGTPNFFVNGRKLVGAQPFESFDKLIGDELKKAQDLVAKGTPRARVYEETIKNGATKPAVAAGGAPPEDDNKVYDVKVGPNDYAKGPAKAKVTIVEFSEFQCPFCARVNPTIKQITDKYGNDVRVVFKHNPLSFHKDAPLASEAALAAGEQGKFWEMHDLLFANQRALTRPDLEKYAQELGLNMDKFKKALDTNKFKAQVDADIEAARTVGASGTPTFFINGKKLRGAQPFESFQRLIDEALKK